MKKPIYKEYIYKNIISIHQSKDCKNAHSRVSCDCISKISQKFSKNIYLDKISSTFIDQWGFELSSENGDCFHEKKTQTKNTL